VNLAARISRRAGSSEVLVTTEVVEASSDDLRFEEIGEAELKGFAAPVLLHRAVKA
jgi:class 3 adenylate cyclase